MKNFISEMLPFVALFSMLAFASCTAQKKISKLDIKYQSEGNAILAHGDEHDFFYTGDACFWCTEGIWDEVPGVLDVKSGYLGGHMDSPSYTDHGEYAEGNKILFDASKTSINELIEYYFLVHSFGKSPDKGHSYRAVLHIPNDSYLGTVKKEYYKAAKINKRNFQQEVIVGGLNWTDAEDYHQDYLKRLDAGEKVVNPGYGRGESQPRRDRAKKKINKKLSENKLDAEEHYIMVKGGTERAFSSPLNDEKRSGYYVSPATGDTLFVSTDKFNSGTGWPSFDAATDKVALGPAEQGGYEVIEKSTGYHLGHLFLNEGFTENEKRYCINGDALEFVPDDK